MHDSSADGLQQTWLVLGALYSALLVFTALQGPKDCCALVQQGYLSSRNTLIGSIFNEANNDNAGATMVWEWIAWQISDPSYDFSVGQDGSDAIYAQIAYMNGKVSCCAWAAGHA
jgi:hypothetical protein